MALTLCRECKREVSTTAKKCPHCGATWPANRIAGMGEAMQGCGCVVLALLLIPLLVALCAG
jgi:hypothetical protein